LLIPELYEDGTKVFFKSTADGEKGTIKGFNRKNQTYKVILNTGVVMTDVSIKDVISILWSKREEEILEGVIEDLSNPKEIEIREVRSKLKNFCRKVEHIRKKCSDMNKNKNDLNRTIEERNKILTSLGEEIYSLDDHVQTLKRKYGDLKEAF